MLQRAAEEVEKDVEHQAAHDQRHEHRGRSVPKPQVPTKPLALTSVRDMF